MDRTPVEIAAPTSRAWDRMVFILFRPFDLAKWCLLGFTAWLASLMENGGPGQLNLNSPSGDADSDELEEMFDGAGEFVRSNLEWIVPVVIIVFLIFVALYVVLTWVSSRGKFMFLDNVVHNRALVGYPWKQYRAQGNSLFKWRVWFGVITLLLILLLLAPTGWSIYQLSESAGDAGVWIGVLIVAGVLFVALLFLILVVTTFLEDFVVPLMYRNALATTDAWKMFLPLFLGRPGVFILYLLWRIVLGMAGALAIMAVCLVTCCIGLILLSIPYVGAVLLLPMTVFFRSLSLEFLRQFGSEFDPMASHEFPGQVTS